MEQMLSSERSLVESASDLRRIFREDARRRRTHQRLATLAIALAPILLAGLYLAFLAAPRYVAEARYSVQAAMPGGQASAGSGITSLLSKGNDASSAASGFVDGWAVQDFLNSRDCMRQLNQRIGLKRFLGKPSLDVFTRLGKNPTEDALFRAYQSTVHNSYNMLEQINVLEVDGFSPSDSEAISNGLLAVARDFVNKMNQQGIEDALRVSRQAVEKAEQQDQAALVAISRWRNKHGNVDPTADAGMLLSQVGQLETSLSDAEMKLAKVEAIGNPSHPMLGPAQRDVDDIKNRLENVRNRMSGQGDTPASQLKTYSELTNQQTFADSNLLQARQGYQQAFTNAMGLQRYLSIIAQPVAETRASLPSPWVVLLLALGVGCALAGGYHLVQALYRSFRYA